MENSEHMENWRTWNTISSWVTFIDCAGEQWRILSTWRTGEHGLLSSWIIFEICDGEQWRIQSTWRTGERVEYSRYDLVGLHLVCAGEQWRILSTWRTGER